VGVRQPLEQERTVSPSTAPREVGASSPRSCDNDESQGLRRAGFAARTPSLELGIPAITLILTGTIGRGVGGKSRSGACVVTPNPVRVWTLAYVFAPLIVIPHVRCIGGAAVPPMNRASAAHLGSPAPVGDVRCIGGPCRPSLGRPMHRASP